ncbi:carbohydrate ABC transporter permease [Paenibacillus sp. GCM10027626]|uniref:carbohydrate ABC transporter permease n=1 Tax=Paenibacillus sp. GCM10027626 TaxID=3273411 RepID=UPI0036424355
MRYAKMRRYRMSSVMYDTAVLLFCTVFSLICFYPIWYVFLGSISSPDSGATQAISLLPPVNPYFGYYKTILQGAVFQRAMFVSVTTTLLGAFLSVLITGTMAYGVSKTKIKGMRAANFYMVVTMFFSGGLIPYFLLVKNIGLYNTYPVLIIGHLLPIWNFILMRNYFAHAVPVELEDAAVIDGANDAILFFKVIMPISMPLFATMFLLTAVNIWNDWFTYMIFVNRIELQPFTVVLQKLLIDPNQYLNRLGTLVGYNTNMVPTALKMTTIMIALIPIFVLYPFLQKYFAKGMLIGAVKG